MKKQIYKLGKIHLFQKSVVTIFWKGHYVSHIV